MILLLSGSLRAHSTNTALLRTVACLDADTVLYDSMRSLPHFDPDDDSEPLDPLVESLRDRVGAAEAIVICSPEYAGALPGSFKNALDWLVGCTAMSAKPTAVVNVSSFGASTAETSLRIVLGYLMADIVEAASVRIAVERRHVNDRGTIDDPAITNRIVGVLEALRAHAGHTE